MIDCYDCGSPVVGHHTPSCDLAEHDAIRDLPEIPGTQWWDKHTPNQPDIIRTGGLHGFYRETDPTAYEAIYGPGSY